VAEPAVAIIPARLASTRFPRKMLADRTGKTLIRHVWERATLASSLSRVVIATDSPEVAHVVRAFGGEAVMTREDHPNGTSRLAEAAASLGLSPGALVVNVQGDEPEIEPLAIDAAVAAARASTAPVATLASPFAAEENPDDPNIVKVVLRRDGTAMYFSRARVPHPRQPAPAYRHVGLYVYRADFLAHYVTLAPTPLEMAESLEQLRVLEHGYAIAVAVVNTSSRGIDTPEQYDAFVRRVASQRPTA